jgi:hypothetical protein
VFFLGRSLGKDPCRFDIYKFRGNVGGGNRCKEGKEQQVKCQAVRSWLDEMVDLL